MLKKDLFILNDYFDLSKFKHVSENCDWLALTPSAMLSLERSHISYITLEEFYSHRQFRIKNNELIRDTEELFCSLDKKYEGFLSFPRAFSGNIYDFLIVFADLFYISEVCREIQRKGYRINYIITDKPFYGWRRQAMNFSCDRFSFINPTAGIRNKLKLFDVILSCQYIPRISQGRGELDDYRPKRSNPIPLKLLFGMILSKVKSHFFFKKYDDYNGTIFVIQDGFEVAFLRQRMYDIRFVNPIEEALLAAEDKAGAAPAIDALFVKELADFVTKWFPGFGSYILQLFGFYHKKIIGRLPNLFLSLNAIFDRYKPLALFYSAFSCRIHEDLCAHIANRRGIPIFYFQHGGTHAFFRHSYEKYHEQNEKINKIHILNSQVEQALLSKRLSSAFKSKALGSIKLYNLHRDVSRTPSVKKGKILYCASSIVAHAFKDLMCNVPDRDMFEQQKDIIRIAYSFSLEMGIKIPPYEEAYYYEYFKNLVKIFPAKKFTIIKKGLAEEILRNYDLLILDTVGTALVPASIVLNIPVILYLKDASYLQNETAGDLEQNFYIARDSRDLEKYIKLYITAKLPSKFSDVFLNRYAFPVGSGDPAVHIEDFVRAEIARANG